MQIQACLTSTSVLNRVATPVEVSATSMRNLDCFLTSASIKVDRIAQTALVLLIVNRFCEFALEAAERS